MLTRPLSITLTIGVALTVGACVTSRETSLDRNASRGTGQPAGLVGQAGTCGHGTAFHAAQLVPGLESSDVISARLSPDEQTVYLSLPQTPGVPTGFDLYVSTRASASAPFGPPSTLAISTSTDDYWASPSGDGLSMFYESGTLPDGGPSTASRIWYATRANTSSSFAMTANAFFDATASGVTHSSPYFLPSADVLYWASIGRPESAASQDLWTADVSSTGAISNARRVPELAATGAAEYFPVATDDNLELFFARSGTGAAGDDAFVATRASTTVGWRPATKVSGAANINTNDSEWPAWVSPDSCRLYFIRTKWLPGGTFESRLWVADRTPGEAAPSSDVTCTYRREADRSGACSVAACAVQVVELTDANVALKIRDADGRYVIAGAGDGAYLASGGTRHSIDLVAPQTFSAFWTSGSSFSLAGDPPAEAYQPEVGSPPELRTSLAGSIAVTDGVETSVSLHGVRWPVFTGCPLNCVTDQIFCTGTGIAERQ